jgi:hypothetical protein
MTLNRYSALARGFSMLLLLLPLLPVFADPMPKVSGVPATGTPTPAAYATVSHLGESEQQAALREGQLLSRRRATDPFGNTIRGPYKALPALVQAAAPTPGQETTAEPVVILPTLEKAVQELTIRALDVSAHEILIGSRAVREGDLLVLESGGRQFLAWVQNVGVHGVMFCDINLRKHFKSLASGPKELPAGSAPAVSDIHNFLNKETPR